MKKNKEPKKITAKGWSEQIDSLYFDMFGIEESEASTITKKPNITPVKDKKDESR